MEERDTTQDWALPRGGVPLVGELEARIDEAVVIARASEEGVREVGEMALDAARQARRAAEAAENSARAAAEAVHAPRSAAAEPVGPVEPSVAAAPTAPRSDRTPREVVIDPLKRFNERADALAARLRELQRVPI